jgi:DNA-directed RNA polymerase subunit RPC12/RpoP
MTDKNIRTISADILSVERCPLDYYCAKTWDELEPTDKANVHFCKDCSSEVFFCETVEEFDLKAQQGMCVAYRVVDAGTQVVLEKPVGLPKRPR